MSIPSGYTRLKYIQSTGTQYIDTGFKPNQDTRVVCDFDMVKNLNSKDAYIFGARIASGNTSFGFANLHNQTPWYATYANEAGNYDTGSNTGRHTVDMSKNNLIVDGTSIHTFTYETFQSSFNLHLFAVNTNGTVDTAQIGVVNLYSCQIYDNGTLVRDFIPCTNASGTAGLWDDVNSVFYTNAGSGSFTAGPDAGTPAGDHNTLLGGVAYAIEGGTVLLGGTEYELESGMVMVDGTVYEISFGSTCVVTISGTLDSTYGYVTINGTKYTTTGTYELKKPVTISVYVGSNYVQHGNIYCSVTLDGTKVQGGMGAYEFETEANTVTIEFAKKESSSKYYSFYATITTS